MYSLYYEDSFVFETPERTGYTFLGWYDGDEKLKETVWKFTEDKTFKAKWQINQYQFAADCDQAKGQVSGTSLGTYDYGTEISVSAQPYLGYDFLGWYTGNTKVSEKTNYSFRLGAKNVKLTALFETKKEMVNFEFTSTLTECTVKGVKDKTVTKIVIPDYVTSVYIGILKGCDRLESLTIPFVGENEQGISNTYFGYIFGAISYENQSSKIPSSLKSVVITGKNEINEYAFYECSGLTNITIPDGVTSIGYAAFSNCSGLTDIIIPDSVTNIERCAFFECSRLTGIIIPDSVTIIQDRTFSGCSGLTSVTIGKDVWRIISSAFENCYKLVEVINKSGLKITKGSSDYGYVAYNALTVKQVGRTAIVKQDGFLFYPYEGTNYLLGYSGKETDLVLPDSYNGNSYQIYKYAFYNCSGLTSVTIGNGVTSIGYAAFSGCSGLTSMTIPYVGNRAGVTANDTDQYPFGFLFGTSSYTGGTKTEQYYYYSSSSRTSSAFYIPSSLKSVTVTGGNILYGAFYNCSGLTSVTIPDSVTSIGSSAFSGCSGLTGVYINDLSAWCKIQFNSNKTYPYNYRSNPLYYAKNLYINKELVTNLLIPDSVTSIGSSAFSGCSGLTSVTIGKRVTSIGSNAFESCSGLTGVYINDLSAWYKIQFNSYQSNPLCYAKNLYINKELVTNLVIPDSVTSIGSYAFYNCSGLTSVTIPDSVTSIGSEAFSGCSGLTSVTIPDSVTSIGSYAFSGCSGLTSVTIGKRVTSIGSFAFSGCRGLTSVVFQDPYGWWYNRMDMLVVKRVDISSSDLKNPATAARYLTSTYDAYYWKKS